MLSDERRAEIEAEERERILLRQQLEGRRGGSGGNTLAWVVAGVILLFVFGIAKCGVEVKSGEARSGSALLSLAGSLR